MSNQIVFDNSETLFDNEWVQMKKVVAPEKNIENYIYSHENRCNGQIISILPYRELDGEREYLIRVEAVPCWELDTLMECSLTGGVDDGMTPEETAVKELHEESGYLIEDNKLVSLGTMYGIKSSDTIYYLFTCDLTGLEQQDELEIETELDKSSFCKWVKEGELNRNKDPFIYVLFNKIPKKKVEKLEHRPIQKPIQNQKLQERNERIVNSSSVAGRILRRINEIRNNPSQ